MDVKMAETSYVGLQRFCRMSRHMLPSAYTAQTINTLLASIQLDIYSGDSVV